MKAAVDDENLDVTADHILVLRNAGPQGGPGMPEWGMLPIPAKLVKQGVRDMLRLSDARMSGTSYGACILHVSPESHVGGPLALRAHRRPGHASTSTPARIHIEVPDEELARRRAAWTPPEPRFERGYGWMFSRHIRQADEGCDFDFLRTDFGAPVRRARHLLTIHRRQHDHEPGNPRQAENRQHRDAVHGALQARPAQPVHPGRAPAESRTPANMVGEAFTLRYIPAREDLNPISVFQDRDHPQRKAVEQCPPGAVLVIDSRKDARAASAGSILVSRLMVRGVAGVVTDGGFRDSPEIAELAIPAYHHRPSAPTNLTLHQALDINVPIGCGDVPVLPGDVVVGDARRRGRDPGAHRRRDRR